jgi:hypothetical protein
MRELTQNVHGQKQYRGWSLLIRGARHICADNEGIQDMDLDNSKGGVRSDVRRVSDRRRREQIWLNDRRVRPDRRLNNIAVEWIPFADVKLHPIVNDALVSHRIKKRVSVTCDENRQGNERRGSEQSIMGIFQNTRYPMLDLRKGRDRRTHDQKQPYDRRSQPDRRLNQISVEWITD